MITDRENPTGTNVTTVFSIIEILTRAIERIGLRHLAFAGEARNKPMRAST